MVISSMNRLADRALSRNATLVNEKNMGFCPLQSGELIALPRFVGICLRFSNRTHARWMTFTVKLPKLYVVNLFEPAFPPLPHDGRNPQVTNEELSRARNMLKCNVLTHLESRLVLFEDIGRQMLTYGQRETPEVRWTEQQE